MFACPPLIFRDALIWRSDQLPASLALLCSLRAIVAFFLCVSLLRRTKLRCLSLVLHSALWGRILGRNWDKSLPPCYLQSPQLTDFTPPPPPPSKSGLKLVCNVNIVYGNLKSETLKIMSRNLHEIVRSWIRLTLHYVLFTLGLSYDYYTVLFCATRQQQVTLLYCSFLDSGRNSRFYCLLILLFIRQNFYIKQITQHFRWFRSRTFSCYFLVIYIKKTRNLCFQIRQSTSALNIWNSFVYNLGMQCISIIVGGVSPGESGGLTHPIIHMEIYYMCYTSTTTQLPHV